MESPETIVPDEGTPFTCDHDSPDRAEDNRGIRTRFRQFYGKLKGDRTYRRNYVLTLNLVSSFFVLVCMVGREFETLYYSEYNQYHFCMCYIRA